MDINQITSFLGWCTAINIAILSLTTVFLIIFKEFAIKTHSKLTGVSPSKLPALYFSYLGNYKIAVLTFNLVPYVALTLMY